MEHVEVLERLRGVLEHGKMGDKCLIAPDLVTAAIAALSAPQSGDWVLVPREPTPEMLSAAGRLQACECGFVGDMSPMDGEEYAAMLAAAPQPPAEAQAVAWEWEYIGGDHYPRGHKVARSLREMDPTNPPYPETWRPTRPLIYGDTAPPSAPVGVEGVEAALQKWLDWCNEHNEEPEARSGARIAIEALAQQPAAVDELIHAARELRQRQRDYLSDPKDRRDENKGRLVGVAAARVDAALEALSQPGGSDNE